MRWTLTETSISRGRNQWSDWPADETGNDDGGRHSRHDFDTVRITSLHNICYRKSRTKPRSGRAIHHRKPSSQTPCTPRSDRRLGDAELRALLELCRRDQIELTPQIMTAEMGGSPAEPSSLPERLSANATPAVFESPGASVAEPHPHPRPFDFRHVRTFPAHFPPSTTQRRPCTIYRPRPAIWRTRHPKK